MLKQLFVAIRHAHSMLEDYEFEHGNLKLSNIFVEYAEKRFGNVSQKVPVLVLSDRHIFGKPSNDDKAFANIMH